MQHAKKCGNSALKYAVPVNGCTCLDTVLYVFEVTTLFKGKFITNYFDFALLPRADY